MSVLLYSSAHCSLLGPVLPVFPHVPIRTTASGNWFRYQIRAKEKEKKVFTEDERRHLSPQCGIRYQFRWQSPRVDPELSPNLWRGCSNWSLPRPRGGLLNEIGISEHFGSERTRIWQWCADTYDVSGSGRIGFWYSATRKIYDIRVISHHWSEW